MRRTQPGFSLIELMIVIAVIGVLAAIALPNYQSYMMRTACEDAKGVLAGAANSMERYRAQNNSYTGANLAGWVIPRAQWMAPPSSPLLLTP